ncbi:MAG: 16S rRNA (guanine(527)-N(7))-methyltransferase RsmG [Bacilli bacterium]|nr:16S rRNA (guanine(527)-N(7))-methyltransferase RsmG [Bacilli bacterium]
MNINKFKEELKKIGIEISDFQLNQLQIYYEMIIEYNKVMNLTGITDKEQVYLKHFYDSITLASVIDLTKEETLCDIGTGAGFPGLVLKIVFPHLKITLLDSLNKRIKFLNLVIERLDLDNIFVIHTRAEDYAINNRNKFDITTARAVAHLSILLEYAIPMTKQKKYFIAMKANIEQEISEIDNALLKLNTKLITKKEFKLPMEESNRTILKFQKEKDNVKFPRKNSEILKNKLL